MEEEEERDERKNDVQEDEIEGKEKKMTRYQRMCNEIFNKNKINNINNDESKEEVIERRNEYNDDEKVMNREGSIKYISYNTR